MKQPSACKTHVGSLYIPPPPQQLLLTVVRRDVISVGATRRGFGSSALGSGGGGVCSGSAGPPPPGTTDLGWSRRGCRNLLPVCPTGPVRIWSRTFRLRWLQAWSHGVLTRGRIWSESRPERSASHQGEGPGSAQTHTQWLPSPLFRRRCGAHTHTFVVQVQQLE